MYGDLAFCSRSEMWEGSICYLRDSDSRGRFSGRRKSSTSALFVVGCRLVGMTA
jgi:hypothetical protein